MMKRVLVILALAATGTVWALPAQATVIDFEAFADYQNLQGVNLGGVTLYEPQLGIVEVFANNRFAVFYRSPTNAVASDDSVICTYPILGVFDSPQSSVSLWAGDYGGDIDRWELEAFDAAVGGNSLGLVQSALWNGNPYSQLSINAPGIWRFEARFIGSSGFGIGYDDLSFSGPVIPAPGALVLAGIGMSLVGGLRRRRML